MATVEHAYPLALPAYPTPRSHSMRLQRVVAGARSPFTLQEQVQKYPGAAWHLEMDYPPMSRVQAALWRSLLLKLEDRYGTFRAGDPDWPAPRGAIAAALTVDGAGQTGNRIQALYAGAALTPLLLLEGDYIQIGDYMYAILEDCGSDSAGRVTLTFAPSLRSSPGDAAAIAYQNCTTVFRLDSDSGWSANELRVYGFSLRATEAVPAS